MSTHDEGLTAAIIGLSWIGADPAGPASDPVLGTAIPYSHASAYAAVPEVTRLVGCDLSEQARTAFAERWSGRYPGLAVHDDLETTLRETRPDIVSVVTPDHLHVPVLLAALDAGVRMIFCEKPLALELAEADEVVRAARATGATISVNYTRRWMPEPVEARAQVRAGAIGRLSQVILQLGGPRAMLFRNLTHSLDLMSFFAEADPVRVHAELEEGFADYGTAYRGDGQDPDKEPGANVYVAYDNGVRGYLAGQKSMVVGDSVQLVGSTGRIVIDSEGLRLQSATDAGMVTRRLTPQYSIAGMAAAVAELVACHRSGTTTASPPEEARRAVALATGILASQADGTAPVTLPTLES